MSTLRMEALALILAVGTCGCATFRSPVIPYTGGMPIWGFNATAFPVDTTFEQNSIGEQRGASAAHSVLGLFAWGDCSVQSAARNGGIQSIDHIDASFTNILGIYTKYETIVYGSASPGL